MSCVTALSTPVLTQLMGGFTGPGDAAVAGRLTDRSGEISDTAGDFQHLLDSDELDTRAWAACRRTALVLIDHLPVLVAQRRRLARADQLVERGARTLRIPQPVMGVVVE